MSRTIIAVAAALLLSAAPQPALATEQGAAAGAVTGAVAGAIVGGPVGAAIGAVVGGVTIGVASGPSEANAVQPPDAPVEPRSGARAPYDPATTGSVFETTCIRDARGVARCRREVVR